MHLHPFDPEASLIHVTTLGRLLVERDGRPINLRRKDILLLVYVAFQQRPVSRVLAATLLWGETPDGAARLSLRQAIWRLRAEAGEAVVTTATDIAVDATLLTVDVLQIGQCVEAGRYREAMALWHGEFLAGADAGATNEFESWVEEVRDQTRQRLSLSLHQLVRDAARAEDWSEAARHAARWTELVPGDPTAALELARALRAAGKPAEALARLSAYTRNGHGADLTTHAEIQQLTRELGQAAARAPAVEPAATTAVESPHIQLIQIWERTSYGRSACAVVRGERGEAARVCRNFLTWIDTRGARTQMLRSNAGNKGTRKPFDGVRAIIDGLRNAPGLSGAPDDALAVLAAWSPALRDRFPRLDVSPLRSDGLEDPLRRVLEAVADEVPVVIYVERADVCDPESAALLSALMRDAPPRTLLLLPLTESLDPAPRWSELPDTTTTIILEAAKRRRWPFVAAAVLLLGAGAVFAWARSGARADDPVAVGVIDVIGVPDSLGLGRAVPGLLASKLALIPALQVVSSARMHEISSLLAARGAAGVAAVARRAGARTLIEGEMFKQGSEMRLALRRVRLSTGKVEQSYEVSSDNVFALVDEAADQIARSYHVDVPRQSIADVTTSSIVAYRFYEEGLRAYYQNDRAAAYRDFRAALNQDSAFAMAAYYASQSSPTPDDALRLFQRAVQLGEHAGDHDRLLIQAQWAVRNGSHSLYPLAETLAIRYPHDADGQYYFGLANNSAGRYAEAGRRFQLALTLDSLSLLGHSVPCRACEAIENLINTLNASDSLRAAERVARKWVALQPWSLNAWTALGGVLEFQGRYAAADSAFTHAEAVQPELSDLGGHRFELALRAGRFAAADSMLALGLASEKSSEQGDAMFRSLLSLRAQGRLKEALVIAREMRRREPDVISRSGTASLEARVLMEMGRYRVAAALYDSVAQFIIRGSVPRDQRQAAAWLTNEAAALAALRDTSRLAELERRVQYYGSLSVEKRDRTLYHYVHALRQELAGDVDGAIESYRAALLSPTTGNVRASLGLGRALVARGRSAEAIGVLDAAIRGSLGASGTAVPKTELHAALGEAFEAAGQPARARAEYAWVLNAWRRADPEVQVRRARIEQRLRALQAD